MRKYNKSPSKIKSFVFLGQQTTDNRLCPLFSFALSFEQKMLVAHNSMLIT